MKPKRTNRIHITIQKSAKEIIEFLLNPQNTPKWIDTISHEETNEWPVKEGSVYRNKTTDGTWHEYILTSLEPNHKGFILKAKDGNYHVRYTITPVSESACDLEYFEWVIRGHLPEPFFESILKKLKMVLER